MSDAQDYNSRANSDSQAPDFAERGELPALRRRLLAGMLRHAPFDGWSDKALQAAARDEGVAPELAAIAFPGGPLEIADFFSRDADRQMVEALPVALSEAAAQAAASQDIGAAALAPAGQPGHSASVGPGGLKVHGLKIREKVALAVRTRLAQHEAHREALRALAAFLAMPAHAGHAACALWRTVDAMWYAIGDRSTDFNYYSKRALLAGIYGSTILVWLDDRSEGAADSFAFLDRRIDGAMAFERGKARWQQVLNGVFGRAAARARPGASDRDGRYGPGRPGATRPA